MVDVSTRRLCAEFGFKVIEVPDGFILDNRKIKRMFRQYDMNTKLWLKVQVYAILDELQKKANESGLVAVYINRVTKSGDRFRTFALSKPDRWEQEETFATIDQVYAHLHQLQPHETKEQV